MTTAPHHVLRHPPPDGDDDPPTSALPATEKGRVNPRPGMMRAAARGGRSRFHSGRRRAGCNRSGPVPSRAHNSGETGPRRREGQRSTTHPKLSGKRTEGRAGISSSQAASSERPAACKQPGRAGNSTAKLQACKRQWACKPTGRNEQGFRAAKLRACEPSHSRRPPSGYPPCPSPRSTISTTTTPSSTATSAPTRLKSRRCCTPSGTIRSMP